MPLAANRALLEAFRKGERSALEQIYWDHAQEVVGLLTRGFTFAGQGRTCRFQGYKEALDVQAGVQEVFARAFSPEARTRYDGLSPYRAYLLAIARNMVIDDLRRKGRLLFLPQESLERFEGGEAFGEPVEQPDQALERKQTQQLVQAFVLSLRPKDRSVYHERFELGKSQAEAARSLRLSRSKVMTAEQRIRSHFLKLIKRHGLLHPSLAPHAACPQARKAEG